MKMLDLFSGIGGFHKGFEQAGYQFDWVGFSEIDKYASAVYKYNYKESEELGDIKLIRPERDLPNNIDILCGGFPCQAFSMAGKRKAFNDTRGTLFFEIARILRHYKQIENPIPCFLLENVKGLLSSDNGRTFATIYRVLDNLGYTIEFQLLNTRWWLPQNRERIYIVGYIGNRGRPQVFPIGEPGGISDNRNAKVASTLQHPGHSGGNYKGMTMIETFTERSFDGKREDGGRAIRYHKVLGETPCLSSQMGMGGNNVPMMKVPEATKKGGLYKVRGGLQKNASEIENCSTALTEAMGKGGGHIPLLIKEATKKGYAEAEINNPLKDKTNKGWHFEQNVYDSKSILRSLKSTQGSGNKPKVIISEATKKGYAEAEEGDSINLSVPNSKTRRGRVGKGEAQTLDTGMQQYTIQAKSVAHRTRTYAGQPAKIEERDDNVSNALNSAMKDSMVKLDTNIRRLTPVECNRLQGFSDDHNKYGVMDGKVVEMSDTQRYKQAGNAVTVDVVQAVAEQIKKSKIFIL